MTDASVRRTYRRLRAGLVAAALVGLVGWGALWFRGPQRWIAFVVYGVGAVLALLFLIALILLRCPKCGALAFGAWRGGCRRCGEGVA